MQVVKSVQQAYTPSQNLLDLLELFRRMLNHCVRIGLAENTTSMKSLSLKAYRQLAQYNTPSYYELCAISKAAGILSNYRKTARKKRRVKEPYAWKLQLVTCYGFKIKNGELLLPLKPGRSVNILLNHHTVSILSQLDQTVRSVALTEETVEIAFSRNQVRCLPI